MTSLRQQMIAALQLSGKSERPQQTSVREVRLLAQFYGKSPDLISEPQLQYYVLHRKNDDGLSPNSMRICYSVLRFFYQQVVERPWKTLELMRAQTEQRLPAVLSLPEVHRLLKAMTPLPHLVSFTTLYSCGLRLNEALYLHVGDIDGSRHMIHVHRGRAPRTAPSHCLMTPSTSCVSTGKPTATPPGSFPPPAALTNTWPAPPPPGPAAASRALFAKPNNAPVSAKRDVGPHTLRNVSPHCPSFVDRREPFSAASLLWAHWSNAAVGATSALGEGRQQPPRWFTACHPRVEARAARLPTRERGPQAPPERRRPRRAA